MNVTTLLATERPMPAGSFALQARTAPRPADNPVAVLTPAGLAPTGLAFAGSHLDPSPLDIVDHGYPCAPDAEAQAEMRTNGSRGYGRRFTTRFTTWCTSAATQVANQVANQFANLTAEVSAQLKQVFAGEATEVTVT